MKRLLPWTVALSALLTAALVVGCCGGGASPTEESKDAPADERMTAPTETPAPKSRAGKIVQEARDVKADMDKRPEDIDKALDKDGVK